MNSHSNPMLQYVSDQPAHIQRNATRKVVFYNQLLTILTQIGQC
jgi:hypothetical protein